jgi:phosphatidylglycerophosphatase A
VRLWIAQGFGVGRIPLAPGTFGSIVGLGWTGLLLATGNLWSFVLGTLLGLLISVWLCGFAENLLRVKDPSSVVLDEISAMPVCFGSWIAFRVSRTGSIPHLDFPFVKSNWLLILLVFIAFRLFDVWKPWPVRQSQSLPAGWGITIDDLLAALYVNLIVLAIVASKVV